MVVVLEVVASPVKTGCRCPSPMKLNVDEGKFENIKIYELVMECDNLIILEDMDVPDTIDVGIF